MINIAPENDPAPDVMFAPPLGVKLEDVLATDELWRRAARPANYEAESQALLGLAKDLAMDPEAILQRLVDTTLTVLSAGSAGVSVISPTTGDFYWPAVAGNLSPFAGGGTPRYFGPCGVVIEQDSGQLFKFPETYFRYLMPVAPLCEVLLAPFHVAGEAVGTVWVVSQDSGRKFDTEDLRLLESMATFAACAYQTIQSLEVIRRSENREAFLLQLVDSLKSEDVLQNVLGSACRLLGTHLKASRVMYAENSADGSVLAHGFSDGVAPLSGVDRLGFGSQMVSSFKFGQTNQSENIEADEAITKRERRELESLDIRAYVETPVLRSDHVIATMVVHSSAPREWTADEISVIQQTAERTWDAVDRARTELALKKSLEANKLARENAEATLRTSPVPLLVLDEGLMIASGNAAFCAYFKALPSEIEGRPVFEICAGLLNNAELRNLLECVLESGQPFECFGLETDLDGVGRRSLSLNARKMAVTEGNPGQVVLVLEDDTEQALALALQTCQRRTLELVARGGTLEAVVELLSDTIEENSGGRLIGSVALLDDTESTFVASYGSGLPDTYHRAVDGMLVSSMTGSCCHAVTQRELIVINDVTLDPKWSRFASFIVPLGFLAAWSTPIIANDGKVLGTFAFYGRTPTPPTPRDLAFVEGITMTAALAIERVRSEKYLRESEDFSRSLMEASPDCVKALDLDGHLLQMNGPGLCLMEIDDFETVRGEAWWNLWPLESRDGIKSAASEALLGGKGEFTGFCPTASGTPKWWEVRATPIRDAENRTVGILAISRDITDQHWAEEALRKSEGNFRMLADNIDQLAWTCDVLGHVTWYNRRWLDYTGLSFEEMQGWDWSKVQHPDHLDRVVAGVRDAAAIGGAWEDTFPLRGKDGAYRWFLSRALPIRDERDGVICWFGTNTDVTSERTAQDALRASEKRILDLNELLESQVTRRTAELLESNEQLQGFTYSVAHDLRQQIRGISANASLVLTDASATLGSDNKEALGRMVGSAKKLATLVDQLLAYARLGRQQPELQTIDITALAEQASQQVTQAFAYPSPTFEIAQGLSALGDSSMLSVALENLLENACKFTRGKERPLIEVGSSDGEFFVRDNGIGFDMRFAEKIFQPFERLSNDDHFSGTGIGLANVKRIIERLGGRVWVEAEPGSGATFYFKLPEVS